MAKQLAQLWGVPAERLHYMMALHKPKLEVAPSVLRVGRIALPKSATAHGLNEADRVTADVKVPEGSSGAFSHTRQTLALMERVAACIQMQEAVLLVGEAGTGKTTVVQHLAHSIGKELLVHNLSEQSDSSELVGGFRPVQLRHNFTSLVGRFESAFCRTFSRVRNATLLEKIALRLARGEWKKLLQLLNGALQTVYSRFGQGDAGTIAPGKHSKRQRTSTDSAAAENTSSSAAPSDLTEEWSCLAREIARAQLQLDHPSGDGMAFTFVEGSLARALQEGQWLLLDEINLASPETLERVAAVLEDGGSVALTERGELNAVNRHSGFRIFGAMNPPTDFGKKELPPGMRARFTELYVSPLTASEDLQLVVLGILQPVLPHPPVEAIVTFYLAALAEADRTLLDGAGQRPQYSLRTLCRALTYVSTAIGSYGVERALWDGFHMTFVTQLQQKHQAIAEALILAHLFPRRSSGIAFNRQTMSTPSKPTDGGPWLLFSGFWVMCDPRGTACDDAQYIVTPTIEERLHVVGRMVAARRFPVLLQGPTSAGKTSMVERLAHATGHRLVRINNHEHTDVQEYIGSFQPGASGSLEFCDGALTQAVRHGFWIVLDELNLAPSEVLEALNRLLDDNRELHLPETGEVVRPHPHFMIFATQNPPGSYGGRKVLSRAFRNRFVQLQMDEIPTEELSQILQQRFQLPPSFCNKMVSVMIELQRRRTASRIFHGKHGFITPRDLFRWAERKPGTYQELAEAGYMLLAERLRQPSERVVVQETLHDVLPRVSIKPPDLYARLHMEHIAALTATGASQDNTVWIPSAMRLYSLVAACMTHDEPALLVGETGTGKTTVCQLCADTLGQRLHIINCHQHTETADFLGGLRPSRDRALKVKALARGVSDFEARVKAAVLAAQPCASAVVPSAPEVVELSLDEEVAALEVRLAVAATSAAGAAMADAAASSGEVGSGGSGSDQELTLIAAQAIALRELALQCKSLFVWEDGPLLTAMRNGDLLLVDEISLADGARTLKKAWPHLLCCRCCVLC